MLGLVFGTANIMTKTITVVKGNFLFETYHVGSGMATNGRGEYKVDMLTNQASTSLMFEHICSRIKSEGKEGWEAVALAFGKELVHLLHQDCIQGVFLVNIGRYCISCSTSFI